MANNFRALGLSLDSQDDYAALIEQATEEGEFMPTERGGYILWSPGHGVEVWVQVNAQGEVTSGKVHFAGESRVRVRVDHLIESGVDGAEVAVYGWMQPHRRNAAEAWPLMCDLPAYFARAEPVEPQEIVVAQIAAFARELTCFPDEDAFRAAQTAEPPPEPDYFIPIGLFSQEGEEVIMTATPQPYATFAGIIKGLRHINQKRAGLDFWVLNVRSNGALFDVIVTPDDMQGEPVIDGIVDGVFYLSAHLLHSLA